MLTADSSLVRAFTKRRPSNPPSRPPAPPVSQEAFHRRQAALRQVGLVPTLSLSQQEAALDKFIPPTSPTLVVHDSSEADRIKMDWVAKNALDPVDIPLPPSPPLTPVDCAFSPVSLMTTTPSDPIPPLDVILEEQQSVPPDFHQPDSPVSSSSHLHPPHVDSPLAIPSRPPSLTASDSKSTRSRSRSRSRARSPLRFLTRPSPNEPPDSLPPPILTTTVHLNDAGEQSKLPTPAPTPTSQLPTPPPQPQRKKSVFARFKRANTILPSSTEPKERDPPTRSKSLFTTVRKSVFGLGPNANSSAASTTSSTNENPNPVTLLPSLPSSLPSLPSWPTSDSNPSLSTSRSFTDDSLDNSLVPTPKPPATPTATEDPESKAPLVINVKVEENDGLLSSDPFGSPSELDNLKFQFPPSPTSLLSRRNSESQESETSHERGRSPSSSANVSSSGHSGTATSTANRKNTRKKIGISLILNKERKNSSPLSSSPPSSSFSHLSPPTSPTSIAHSALSGSRIRGRLGRKATAGTDGLLSVWGGVTGLLGGPTSSSEGTDSTDGEIRQERQALAPTIHNEASILQHMNHIEDEETRRVTELAFM